MRTERFLELQEAGKPIFIENEIEEKKIIVEEVKKGVLTSLFYFL